MPKLGVIGFGRRMQSVLSTLRSIEPDARVDALVDPRADELRAKHPDDLREARPFADARRMLDEARLDGVLVGTRCNLHTPYAIEVLARGVPLFLEKPVAISWEQLDALRRAAERARGAVVVSFPLRVSRICRAARDAIEAGAIGGLGQIQAVNNVPAYSAGYYHGWMRDESQTGGLWLQKATHDFDYINYLAGERPVGVMAMESKTVFRGDMPAGLRCVDCWREDCPEKARATDSWLCSFGVDTGNHDSASAMIRYESGAHAVYTQNFYTRGGACARGASVVGYGGTVAFDWYRDELTIHDHHAGTTERQSFALGEAEGHHGGDGELVRDFLGVMAGTAASRTPLEAALTSVELCLAARDSCRTGSYVAIKTAAEVPA